MEEVLDVQKYLGRTIFHAVRDQAEKLGIRAFVIGGFVRDFFLHRDSNDIDIVVEGDGLELAKAVGKTLKCRVAVFKNFGTAQLRFDGTEIEFVGARRESYRGNSRKPVVESGTLQEDQDRRDFTINAMAFSLQRDNYGELVDPFNGIMDLNMGLIRTPLDPDRTYRDDPLRMIRAVRFATQLDFEIVPESLESIRSNRERLSILSMERISDELNKILLSPKPSRGFELLDSCGLLDYILPSLTALKGVESIEGITHKNNFTHTLKVLDNVADSGGDLWLRWAALLHDVGKASAKKFEKGVGWTFYGHDIIGGKMVPGIFRHLKMPLNDKMKYVQKMVSLHMRPISLVTDEVTDSAVRRLLFDAGDDVDDLMILCRADITSKDDKKVDRYRKNYEHVCEKMAEVEARDAIRNFKNPITGEMVMDEYGIGPCNTIGEIKEYVKNAILDGRIPNDYESARKLMEEKAAELGLKRVSGSEKV
ncbi:MAG: CCA tRNA nucleotidyltransferase [Bacteroidales bacterium]|jgi:poly(A) polymerase|nr:CCA tRNA nucleotidyltransferase [Bacteroidales bacterium]MCI2121296.1 CCA tRNA nucleotidyltransferase [Bacteroidales bacterium]MCI2145214.1 CCA tRNA nucleotidyltransferase [Bacteroidales bacterium]